MNIGCLKECWRDYCPEGGMDDHIQNGWTVCWWELEAGEEE